MNNCSSITNNNDHSYKFCGVINSSNSDIETKNEQKEEEEEKGEALSINHEITSFSDVIFNETVNKNIKPSPRKTKKSKLKLQKPTEPAPLPPTDLEEFSILDNSIKTLPLSPTSLKYKSICICQCHHSYHNYQLK
jgi:hypothetical protein